VKPTIFVLLLLDISIPRAAGAQFEKNTAITLHATSRLVVLDVVLTDLGGNLVRDLTQDDFVVFEDKRLADYQ
jgi:hypothetical protein